MFSIRVDSLVRDFTDHFVATHSCILLGGVGGGIWDDRRVYRVCAVPVASTA